MKFIVVLGDGMADYPIPELEGRTPLEVARKSNMDMLARKGNCGMAKMVPDGMPPQSDTANLSVMGYDPEKYYRGRSPLEAVSMGIDLLNTDIAIRCNLVSLAEEGEYEDKTMEDFSAGEIPTDEARELIRFVNDKLCGGDMTLYPGKSYRHCLVMHNAEIGTSYTPPHDIIGQPIRGHLPDSRYGERLSRLMIDSYSLLKDHPINKVRKARGECAANSIWFWGEGTKPQLDMFKDLYGLDASVVCAVDLIKGLGICSGMSAPDVPGATGAKWTDFAAKGRKAVEELRAGRDLVYIHIEAPDENGHAGDVHGKIASIEAIDSDILAYIIKCMEEDGEKYAIMLLPDHPTPIVKRTHVSDPVPYVLFRSDKETIHHAENYCEISVGKTGVYLENGFELMKTFASLNF